MLAQLDNHFGKCLVMMTFDGTVEVGMFFFLLLVKTMKQQSNT